MKNKAATGLQVAVTILEKWGATTEQGTAILRLATRDVAAREFHHRT